MHSSFQNNIKNQKRRRGTTISPSHKSQESRQRVPIKTHRHSRYLHWAAASEQADNDSHARIFWKNHKTSNSVMLNALSAPTTDSAEGWGCTARGGEGKQNNPNPRRTPEEDERDFERRIKWIRIGCPFLLLNWMWYNAPIQYHRVRGFK
jgi:hypothetical protein